MRRVLSALLPAAMAGAALFMAAPAATAASVHPAASCYGPSCGRGQVSVTVTYGPQGVITLTISASGFKPGEQVQISITLPSHAAGAFTADGNGAFTGQVSLPAGYGRGAHGLNALGTTSGTTASTTFTLSQASGTVHPCTTSASSTHTSGVVLAAAYLSASCLNTGAPAAGLPAAGAAPQAGGAPAVGTANAQHPSQLPFTGSNASTYAAIGALAIGAGGALVLVSRRRRQSAWK